MKMEFTFRKVLLFSLFSLVLFGYAASELENEVSQKLRSPPHKNVRSNVIDGTGQESSLNFEVSHNGLGEAKSANSKVSVSTVALFTLAMAAATGLGAVSFFFVELDPQWAGLCNGMAAGVMLAASFDLIQEGQGHGAGNWVVLGLLAGGLFFLAVPGIESAPLFSSIFYVFAIFVLVVASSLSRRGRRRTSASRIGSDSED